MVSPNEVDEIRGRVAAEMPTLVDELAALVRIPTIAFPGFDPANVVRGADEVVRILSDAGFPTVRKLEFDGGMPAVYAEAPGPEGSPTVLLYAHYDVQPAGDEDAWHTPPFEPVVKDGQMFGRGAADDKSGVILHAGVMRAFGGKPPCTVRVVIEGEEEYGGKFEEYPRENPEFFAADAIIVADTGNIVIGQPTFTTALRGMADATVEVRTLAEPVHSGMFGGPAPDALLALIALLATLRDENGDCAIVGLPSGPWDGAEQDEQTFRELSGVLDDQPLLGTGTVSSRLVSMPTVNVVGIDAPSVEQAINAVIPVARAKVSLRIPPDADPQASMDALVEHLSGRAPWGVQVTVTPGSSGAGYTADTSGPAYASARAAMRAAYGKDPVEQGAGGSIPLIEVLADVVPQAELLLFGAQDMLARIHAPNERLDLGELERAIVAEALLLMELAAAKE